MRADDAATLLDEARVHLAALHAGSPTNRRRLEARLWFILNQAWSILTGARPGGSATLH